MKPKNKTIIYTDLDGIFLDAKNHSFQRSLPALRAAMERDFCVVFCSSKTRAEIEHIRKATEVYDPFIVESGGAIFIPEGYFPFKIEGGVRRHGYEVIEMGESYWRLVEQLRLLRSNSHDLSVVGFSDLTIRNLALLCNLTYAEASRAKDRAYSEPFHFRNATAEVGQEFLRKVSQGGLYYSNGDRCYHLHGAVDKGRAVRLLNAMFRRAFGSITTVGVGEGPNDAPMLSSVEWPIIVKQLSGTHDPELARQISRAELTEGIGPQGWADTIMRLANRSNREIERTR